MTPGTKLDSRLRIFCIFLSLWFLLFALSQPLDDEFQPQQRLNDATLDHLLSCGSGPSCVTCCRCYCRCRCCCRVLGSPNDSGSGVRDSAAGKYWFRVVAGFVLIHISLMRKTIGNEIAASVYTRLFNSCAAQKYARLLAQPAQRNKQSVATSMCSQDTIQYVSRMSFASHADLFISFYLFMVFNI